MGFSLKGVGLILLLAAVISYGLALIWWRAWMYQGIIGPIPFMHWFVSSDGEGSYSLIELEMFINLLVIILASYFLVGFKKKSQRAN